MSLEAAWYIFCAINTWLLYRIARRMAREVCTVEERHE